MYEDWVIVNSNPDFGDITVCKAPRWSGLKQGDLVKVEGWKKLATVAGCITVNTEKGKNDDLIEFITYLLDDVPRLRIVSKYTEEEMEYESV